ncbi:vWA domain-containing protein [Crassaminicella profunda]|uniref:vWA domain-containing protein n=1 Tax=Crassaminicella profunda TaxID=1286698 RepID=UPI001CA74D68|nr:BatA and WFA domain-containing protein [Crassaminicella profunda]QZY56104.1 BatA and WFA domain-containing protein [Crassaminicella profunda]
MKFYSPLSFFYLLAGVPIILMYLLKKQHEEKKIPSTYLWEKALRDMEANKPWQKLRKNILLFLQLLITLCIVFFLSNPYILSDKIDGENIIIMLDKSASMQSTDVEKSRFDAAKEEIRKLIDGLSPNTYVTLMTVENTPQIVAKTKDKRLLKRKLSTIDVGNGNDHVEEAIKVVKAMMKDKNHKILYYTDKGIKESISNMVVKNIHGDGKNIAIENIAHRMEEDGISVLINVTNFSDEAFKGDLILYTDETVFDVKTIEIKSNEKKNYYFRKIPKKINLIKGEIDIEDSFKLDNERYHMVHSNPSSKVLLTSKQNIFLEKAIGINKTINLYKANEIMEDLSGYDLYVYDGLVPKVLPKDGNIILFNPPIGNGIIKVKGKSKAGRWKQKNDPIFNAVDIDFNADEVKKLVVPKWANPTLFSDDEPVMFKGQKGNQKIFVVGFDLHHTDFPLKIDFPIFVQNLLEDALSLNRQDQIEVIAGNPIKIDVLPKSEEVIVKSPKGDELKIGPPFPLAPFTDTNEVGVYTIKQTYGGEQLKNYFVSNIDTKKESDIGFFYENKNNIEEKKDSIKIGRNLKNIFLWMVLILLLVEWVVYHGDY